ncbi:MAG: phosphatase PAP2 family protein [Rothia sp. (in: high G+C Gram-positive bacteria)]|nr:phosphatase PAP2 family protein [Rothia sp. (in: high G+C Gram-positive bacteria)]
MTQNITHKKLPTVQQCTVTNKTVARKEVLRREVALKRQAHVNRAGSARLSVLPTAPQRALMIASGIFLVALIALVATGVAQPLDLGVLSWSMGIRTAGISALMLALTTAFTPALMVVYSFVVATLFAVTQRSFKLWFAIFGGVGVTSVLGQVIKHLVGRARPELAYQIVHETDLSFPSGHATGIAALATALCLGLYLAGGSRPMTRLITAASTILAVLVCTSRIYVAAHWSTDVFAGAALGVSATIAWFWITETLFTIIPAHQKAQEKVV